MNKRFKNVSLVLLLMGLPVMAAYAETSPIETIEIVQQNGAATGTVVDAKGEPLTGASVIVKGTTKGAMVDNAGRFSISGVKVGQTLRVTYIGYLPQEVKWEGQPLSIVLEEDNNIFDEVVVVGYGTQKKANITGAVSSIKSDVLESRPVSDVTQALQGVSPGLNISVGTSGGELGTSMNLNIRGAGSIGSGSSAAPLVLIDGIEGDLATVNPNDIESISVLKDAGSAAIYGARGSFGVILVTTKSGKSGKTHVNYTGNVRFTTATQVPEMVSSLEFAKYWNQASINGGSGAQFSPEQMERIEKFYNGEIDPNLGMNASGASDFDGDGIWDNYKSAYANTNWFNEFYRKNVPSQEHNLSVTGGTEKMNYAVSGNFLNANGVIRHGRDKYYRYTLNAKIGVELASWAHLDYNTKFTRSDYDRPTYLTNADGGLFYHNIARRWPTCPAYDANGYAFPGMEIIELEEGGISREQKNYVTNSAQLVLEPIKDWHITLNGNFQTYNYNNHEEYLAIYAHNAAGEPYFVKNGESFGPGTSGVYETRNKQDYFTVNVTTDYSWNIAEDHNFKVMGGFNGELWRQDNVNASGKTLTSSLIPYLNQTTTNKNASGKLAETAVAGFFGRINYNYKERYLFEANLRYDGSSRFVGDKQWGLFPSFSLGWNLAKEAFMENVSWVNTLKVRGSWGQLGNNRTDQWYPFFQVLTTGAANSNWLINGEKVNTATMAPLVSSVLTWETVETLDFGLDFAFFNNRLSGIFDWYSRSTKDMVGPAPSLPSVLGTTAPAINNCDLRTNGWELELQWRDRIGEVGYGLKGVLSDNITEITKYPNESGTLSKYNKGHKLGEIWGYETEGLAQTDEQMQEWIKTNKPSWGSNWTAGDVMYRDLNGDGVVNSGENTVEDHGDLRIIGNNTARYNFGITGDINWKGIDFSMFWQGTAKRDWNFGAGQAYFWGAQGNVWQSACFKEHLDYWREDNPDAYYPKPYLTNGIQKNQQTQTRYLQNAAYIRLKNIQLGYTFPEQWMSKAHISKLRVYFSADNLLTFSQMASQFDPENLGGYWGSGKTYPLTRSFSFGVNLNF